MDILFEDKDLLKCATDRAYALKSLGQRRAQRYAVRLRKLCGLMNALQKCLKLRIITSEDV